MSELDAALAKVAADARFIFTGVVQGTNATSASLVPRSTNTWVVRIERVHHAAPAVGAHPGQVVTVRVREGVQRAGDRRLVFFTNPIVYGETIVVDAVAHTAAPPELDGIHRAIAQMKDTAEEQRLVNRISSAEVIVDGVVAAMRRAADADYVPRSEHDPDWWVATIQVRETMKGRHTGELNIRFANSRDIAWYKAPKLAAGDRVLLLLHADKVEAGGIPLAVLDPRDVHRAEPAVLERVRRLVASQPGR